MNMKNCLNAPLMGIKIIFYIKLIQTLGLAISAGNTGLSITSILSNSVYLAALVWITEGADKIKVINHAQLLNLVGLAFDIVVLCVSTNTSSYYNSGYDDGWTLAFIIVSMSLRPFHMYVLHKESKNWINSGPVVLPPTIETISTNYANNLRQYDSSIYMGDEKQKPDAALPSVHN